MQRFFAVVIAILIFIIAFAGDSPLLWKAECNGRPIYIVGSHHIAPTSMIDSIPGLRAAIAEADVVVGEIEKSKLMSPEAQNLMMKMAMAPADSTINKLLSPEELGIIDNVFARYAGMPGMVMQMAMFKPAMISTQLAVLQSRQAFPDFNPLAPTFDVGVMQAGEALGKKVEGLEDIDFQINLIFGQPLAEQAAELLRDAMYDTREIGYQQNLAEAFKAQDLDRIWQLITDPELGMTQAELDRTVNDRNKSWAERLPELEPGKTILLVVGCGHLPGPKGLINLLREKGYQVTPVK